MAYISEIVDTRSKILVSQNSQTNKHFSTKTYVKAGLFLLFVGFFFYGGFGVFETKTVSAAACVAGASGNWSNTTTVWTGCAGGGNSKPSAGDTIQINSGVALVVDENTPTVGAITIVADAGASGTNRVAITINSGTKLTSSGLMTINGPTTTTNTTSVTLSGTGALEVGSLTFGTGATNRNITLAVGTGTLTVNGAVTAGSGGTRSITTTGAATLNWNGAAIATGLTFTMNAASTSNFTGTSAINGAYTLGIVEIDSGTTTLGGTGTKVFAGTTLVRDGATLRLAGFAATFTGAVTVGGGTSGILDCPSAATCTGTKTFSSGITVNAGGTFDLDVGSVDPAVTFSGTAGHTNNSSNTFKTGTGTHTLSGTGAFPIAGSGPMNYGATLSIPTNRQVTVSNTNTVTFSALTISSPTAANSLSLSTGSTTTITGTLTMSANSTANNQTITMNGTANLNANAVSIAAPTGASPGGPRITCASGGSGTFNVTTTFTMTGNSTSTGSATVDMLTCTLTVGGLLTITGGSNATGVAELKLSTGTINANAGWTFTSGANQGNAKFTASGSGTINLTGAMSTCTDAATTWSTVNFRTQGTASLGCADTYPNLSVLGGTTSLGGVAMTISGTTALNGTVASTSATGTKTFSGAVTVNSGGVFDLNAFATNTVFGAGITNNSNAANSFRTGSGAATTSLTGNLAGTGTGGINFVGTGALTIASGTTTNNYTGGTVTVGGTLTLTGNWTQGVNSTLNLGGSTATSGAGTFDANSGASNTVTYTAASPTCQVVAYQNLAFTNASGASTVSCAVTTVNGDLTVSTAGTSQAWTLGAALSVGGTFSVGASSTVTTANFTLGVTGATTITGTLSHAGNAALTFATGITINGNLSNTAAGTGSITVTGGNVSGSGTVSLNNATQSFVQLVATDRNFGSTSGANSWAFSSLSFETDNAGGAIRTIQTNTGGSGSIVVDGTLTVGNAGYTYSTILDNDTNDRIIDCNGSINITTKGSFTASSSASLTIATNFTNSGTFTAPTNSTITFDTTATSVISGASTFYNFTSNSASKTINFTAGQTFTFNGVITLDNATLNSTTGSSSWTINHQGTESITNTTVSWSACDGSSTTITVTSGNSGGNNGVCWSFPVTRIISGVVYTNDESTVYGTVTAMKLSVNGGSALSTNSAITTGIFSFNVSEPSNGDVITIWLDTTGSGVQGTTVFKYGASCTGTPDCTGLIVVRDQVRIENFHTGNIAISDLTACDTSAGSGCTDQDIGFDATVAPALTITGTGWPTTRELKIGSSATFAPGGNITSQKIDIAGTYTGSSETLSLGGAGTSTTCTNAAQAPLCVTGTFTPTSNTVAFTSTSATSIAPGTFNNLSFTPAGTVTHTLLAGTFTVGGNLSVGNSTNAVTVQANTNDPTLNITGNLTINNNGIFEASNSGALNVGGSYSVGATNGSFVHNNGTITFTATSGGKTIDNQNSQFGTVVFDGVNGAWQVQNASLQSSGLTVTNGDLSTSGASLYINGTVTVNGTISGTSGGTLFIRNTSNFAGSGSVTVSNLNIGDSGDGAATITSTGSGDVTVTNVLTINASQIFNAGSRTYILSKTGTGQVVKTGTLNFDTSTIRYTGNGATTVDCTLGSYYNLEVKPGGATAHTVCGSAAQTLTVTGAFTIGDGTNAGATGATNNPTVNVTGAMTIANGATYTKGTGALTVSGTLTVGGGTSGIFVGTSTGAINIQGDLTLAVGSTFTKGTETLNFKKGNNQTWTDSTAAGQDLGTVVVVVNGTNTTVNLSGLPKATSITTNASQTIALGSTTLTTGTFTNNGILTGNTGILSMSDTGTPFSNGGTYTYNTSTIRYTGNGATLTALSGSAGTNGYYNLEIKPSSSTAPAPSGTFQVNGSLTVGDGTNAGLNLDTSDATFTVVGSVTIANGATLTLSNTNAFTVGESITKSATGTFTAPASSTVVLNTTATSVLTGDMTFYNLTSTTSTKIIQVDTTTTITTTSGGVLTLTGVTITRETGDSGSWTINHQGTESVTNTTVSWSACHGSSTDITASTDNGNVDGGNNGTCWKFVGGGITVTGTVYSNEGTNAITTGPTVRVKVAGAGNFSAVANVSGVYSISNVSGVAAGTVITIFLDDATENGVTITKAVDDVTTITANIYQDRIILRHENASAITNANINSYDSTQETDGDIGIDSTGTNVVVADGWKLIVWTGKSYTPGGTITTSPSNDGTDSNVDGDFDIQAGATVNVSTSALSVGGDFNNLGTYTTFLNTTTFTATATGHTITAGTHTLYGVTFNGAGGDWSFSDNVVIGATLTVTAGTLSGTNNITLQSSAPNVTGAGVINLTGGTFYFKLGTSSSFGSSSGSNNWTFYNLNFENTDAANRSVAPRAGGSGSVIVSNVLTIGNAGNTYSSTLNLDTSDRIFDVNGDVVITSKGLLTASGSASFTVSGNWTNNGTFTGTSGSTITFDSVSGGKTLSGTLNGASAFYNLVFDGVSGGWSNSTALLVGNNLSINNGTLDNSTADIIVTGNVSVGGTLQGTGNLTVNGGGVTGNGTINMSAGTFLVDGTGNFGGNSAWIFNNLTFGDGSGTTTVTGTGTGGITTNNTLTVALAQILNGGTNTWILPATGTSFVVTGTFTGGTSTVSYRNATSATVTTANYNNLDFSPASGTPTYTLSSGSLSIGGNFSIAGVGNATVTAATNDPTLTVSGDFTIGSGDTFIASDVNDTSVGGSWANSGTFTHSSRKTTFTATSGTKTINNGSSQFYNLEINGSGGTFQVSGNALTVANDLAVNNGTLTGTQNITVNGGDATGNAVGNGTVNLTGGTFLLDGSGTFGSDSDTPWTFYNLTFGDGTGTSSTTTLGSNDAGEATITNVFTIGANHTLDDTQGKPWILSGSGTPLVRNGTITSYATTSIAYTSPTGVTALSSAAMTGANAYMFLIINGTGTFTAGVEVGAKQAIRVLGGTLAMGTNNLTVGDPTVVGSGLIEVASGQSLTQASTGTTTQLSSASEFTCIGANGVCGGGTQGTIALGILIIGDGSTAFTSTIGATSPTITLKKLSIQPLVTFRAGTSNIILTDNGEAFTNAGTFTAGTSTVTYNSASTTGTTVPALAYYNLVINKASNTFAAASGTLAVGGTLTITAGTLDLGANNPATTITGTLTNSDTLSAPTSLTLNGNFSNNGTFTANNGTVVLAPTGAQLSLGGSNGINFYNLSATGQNNKTIVFTNGNTYGVSNSLTLNGNNRDNLYLASASPGSQWTLNFTGNGGLVSYVYIKDSACSGNNPNIDTNSLVDGGNNGACWGFVRRGGGSVGAVDNGSPGGTGSQGGGSSQGGSGFVSATATAVLTNNAITDVNIGSGGSGYLSAPTVCFSGGGGSGGLATAVISGGAVTQINISNGGSNYTSPPSVLFLGGDTIEGGTGSCGSQSGGGAGGGGGGASP